MISIWHGTHNSLCLHSNMVIFKCLCALGSSNKVVRLHSNMVIFKFQPLYFLQQQKSRLHSNMVIFKCFRLSRSSKIFHEFTFQYGYIQIVTREKLDAMCPRLHSNMVIFK